MVVPDNKQDVWQRHCSCCRFYRRCTLVLSILAIGSVTLLMLGVWRLFNWDKIVDRADYAKAADIFQDGKCHCQLFLAAI